MWSHSLIFGVAQEIASPPPKKETGTKDSNHTGISEGMMLKTCGAGNGPRRTGYRNTARVGEETSIHHICNSSHPRTVAGYIS
ncbi:unnamed protein product [Caretta caretta]